MTKAHSLIVTLVAATFLSACSEQAIPYPEASRVDSNALMFFNDPINEGSVTDQVAALTATADQLVLDTTVNGALIGAAVGCGITVLTGSNARECVAGAALGGAGGAVIGNMVGERSVARRVELVAPNTVARELNAATNQFQSIQASLPQLLDQQEAALNQLTMDLIHGLDWHIGAADRLASDVESTRSTFSLL